MIEIDIIEKDSGECLARSKWSAVPDVGEKFSVGLTDYIIAGREWGVCVDGNGKALWGLQCVELLVVKTNA